MTDYTELKAKADAATQGEWQVIENELPCRIGRPHVERRIFTDKDHPQLKAPYPVVNGSVALGTNETPAHHMVSITAEDAAFIAAANPAVVLALIAENDRLEIERAELWRGKRDVEATRDTKSAVIAELKAEVAGLRTGYEAYERVNAELKAEVEALRKDAARYQWLREASSGYIEVVEWIGPHATGMIGEDLDALLDAAMGKGEQS